mgnify:CR=1 FL=1
MYWCLFCNTMMANNLKIQYGRVQTDLHFSDSVIFFLSACLPRTSLIQTPVMLFSSWLAMLTILSDTLNVCRKKPLHIRTVLTFGFGIVQTKRKSLFFELEQTCGFFFYFLNAHFYRNSPTFCGISHLQK